MKFLSLATTLLVLSRSQYVSARCINPDYSMGVHDVEDEWKSEGESVYLKSMGDSGMYVYVYYIVYVCVHNMIISCVYNIFMYVHNNIYICVCSM